MSLLTFMAILGMTVPHGDYLFLLLATTFAGPTRWNARHLFDVGGLVLVGTLTLAPGSASKNVGTQWPVSVRSPDGTNSEVDSTPRLGS